MFTKGEALSKSSAMAIVRANNKQNSVTLELKDGKESED
jgi:hypothetical protein